MILFENASRTYNSLTYRFEETKEEVKDIAKRKTISYKILKNHSLGNEDSYLKIKFDCPSH